MVEELKVVTETNITTTTTVSIEEKYKVVAPEAMQETFMSDSEDEGGKWSIMQGSVLSCRCFRGFIFISPCKVKKKRFFIRFMLSSFSISIETVRYCLLLTISEIFVWKYHNIIVYFKGYVSVGFCVPVAMQESAPEKIIQFFRC